ncbi:Hypothetical predicted protein [Olea europaea subsp. europaea]|uniref:DUF2163 domain-containing protein n=1 Tax=Olea europaea subsp. europaea TaxID=158383 RepID=A0A8S0SGA7_OLEEU|nr:Hypothetical predicted protein [Olea europaea subsp. europaea]
MALDPTVNAALQGVYALMFGAVEILLPSASIRLLDGSAVVSFGGHTFVGSDPTFGALHSVQAIADGLDNEAPSMTLTLLPPTRSAVAALCAPANQGAQVTVWVGVLNPVTGQVIGTPDVRFIGAMDVPTLRVGKNSRAVEISVTSAFDRFFDGDEGVRLNDAWHQSIWPGETGLSAVTAVQRRLPWGSDAPRPGVVTDRITPNGGGGGRGGGIGATNTLALSDI